ncbi:MAG: copper chaperone PCu(A)C [Proteobacteria bacterium]|nr:copper chaperone PCu(A)C [Pseudomonadota bacterium]
MLKIIFAVLSIVSMFIGYDCSKEKSFTITEAWARATPSDPTPEAAYFVIHNHTDADDALVSLITPAAESAELYANVEKNGVWELGPTGPYVIAAGKDLTLRPGGVYVVLKGLKQPLNEGDTFPLTITFNKAGKVEQDVLVKKAGSVSFQKN